MIEIQPHQQRVIDERDELKLKVTSLERFITTDLFKSLAHIEKCDLENQLFAMQTYLKILGKRIKRFKHY